VKGNPKIIKALNEVLASEITAISQYIVHSEMCENWGYHRLHERIHKESIDEMKHAEKLIERILYLEGVPVVSKLLAMRIGRKVPEMLRNDLALENEAVERLNTFIPAARQIKDAGSAELFEEILEDEEGHVDFIESQLDQIEQMGLENYLAQQVGEQG